jgi:hypothetical protein
LTTSDSCHGSPTYTQKETIYSGTSVCP